MSAMQAFYSQLTAAEVAASDLAGLARLTEASLDDLAHLENALEWVEWDGDAAASA